MVKNAVLKKLILKNISKRQNGGKFKGKKDRGGRRKKMQKGGVFPFLAASMLVPSILGILGIGK